MFTRILVPTDFSKPSDAALTYARRLCDATGARLHVMHVVDNVFMRTVLADPRDYEASALRQLQERVSGDDPGAILTMERSESPADEIVRYARVHDINLIVMGTHGRGRVAHLLLGSVAEKVAHTASCPVLTMRETPRAAPTERLRILVPTDFSASADAALGCAKRLAARIGGSIRMLHVLEDSALGVSFGSELCVQEPRELRAERVNEAQKQLSGRTLTDRRSRVTVTSDVVYGPISPMITAYAADNGFDLIVMGTEGREGLAQLVIGSVADSVIRTARSPVMTLRTQTVGRSRAAEGPAACATA